MDKTKKFDLEDRFIDFAIKISNVVDEIDKSKLGSHIAGQLVRCGSSPALIMEKLKVLNQEKISFINLK